MTIITNSVAKLQSSNKNLLKPKIVGAGFVRPNNFWF
jgi:hypothetical protein